MTTLQAIKNPATCEHSRLRYSRSQRDGGRDYTTSFFQCLDCRKHLSHRLELDCEDAVALCVDVLENIMRLPQMEPENRVDALFETERIISRLDALHDFVSEARHQFLKTKV